MISTKKLLSFGVLVIVLTNIARAQKLAGKQTVSLRVPATIKVDGKATEWNYKFQAYNNATEFYYTIANSDTALHLTVQCLQPSVIRRIMNNGLSLTINRSGKMKDPAPMVITYPVFDRDNKFYPEFFEPDATVKPGMFPAPVISQVRFPSGGLPAVEPPHKPISDSLLNVNNTKIAAKAKNIEVTGIKGLDNLMSVYNDEGIKAAGQFDNKMTYTYELSISLKHLGLSAADASKFMYQLKVNDSGKQKVYVNSNGTEDHADPGPPATDFWGTYTLAKP